MRTGFRQTAAIYIIRKEGRIRMENRISRKVLQRLPMYLNLLREKRSAGSENTASSAIAAELGLTEIQVRKDLAAVSKSGRPRVGYAVNELVRDIEKALGYDNVHDAVLVGAGRLGRALMEYPGFLDCGVNIVAGFDSDEAACGQEDGGKPVYPMEKLLDLCRRLRIHMGIITTPAESAQEICDRLVAAGVIAIWNFAPVHLKAPDYVLVKSENMAASLAVLSNHLVEKIQG